MQQAGSSRQCIKGQALGRTFGPYRGADSLHSQPAALHVSAAEQVVLQAPQLALVSRDVSQPAGDRGRGTSDS